MNICPATGPGRPSGRLLSHEWIRHSPVGRDFLYVDISSIDNYTKRVTTPKKLPVDQAPSRARQHLKGGDVLISMTRPNLNAVGLVSGEMHGAIGSTGFDVLRTAWIEPSWLFYLAQTDTFIRTMSGLVQGVLYPAVRPKDIRGYSIPVAPLAEQRRVVAEIEKQFTRLEAGVGALKRVQANLKRYRAAVLKAAVEGRLVPTEAELARRESRSYEPASKLLVAQPLLAVSKKAQAGVPVPPQPNHKEPVAPDTTDLRKLPEGWEWCSLRMLIIEGPQNGLYLPKSAYGGGIPILRIDDFQDGWSRNSKELRQVHASSAEEKCYSLKVGDLVINRVNSPSHLGKALLPKSGVKVTVAT